MPLVIRGQIVLDATLRKIAEMDVLELLAFREDRRRAGYSALVQVANEELKRRRSNAGS